MACPFGPETTAHAEHAALDECIPYATEHLFRSAEVVVSSDHDDPPSHPVERISDVDAAHVNTGGDSKDVCFLDRLATASRTTAFPVDLTRL